MISDRIPNRLAKPGGSRWPRFYRGNDDIAAHNLALRSHRRSLYEIRCHCAGAPHAIKSTSCNRWNHSRRTSWLNECFTRPRQCVFLRGKHDATRSPDAFLALKTYPSSNSPRIMAMANGTKLDVLLRRVDGWWYVKVWPTGEEGWAFSGQGNKAWILCCSATDGSQTEAKPVAREINDFSCDQLWFGRNSIFKVAGYCFKTPRAIAAFGNAGCLYDDISAVRLSSEDQNFAEAIQRAEQLKACPR